MLSKQRNIPLDEFSGLDRWKTAVMIKNRKGDNAADVSGSL